MTVNFKHEITVEDYNHLRRSVGFKQIETAQAQAGLNNSAFLITAVHENKTIGLARVISDGGYVAIISDVMVLPEYQGQGIGKILLTKVMEFLSGNLNNGQGIFVNLMAAKGRESFYKQFGFIERPNDDFGAGMTQWLNKTENQLEG